MQYSDVNIESAKKELRKQMREIKKQLSAPEKQKKSEEIFRYIEQQPWFSDAKVVMCYWSLPDEVFTHDFCRKWMNRKTILLPKMSGPDIEPVVFNGALLREPVLGIEEPVGDVYPYVDMINIIIVPGVAFDHSGNRLGRGKGFYDRLLAETKAMKIGVCFAEQVAHRVPVSLTDVSMHQVVYF